MPKIPKETRWRRFVLFIRGVLLYNTVYWGRASDGLRPPRPTREERREKRPTRDLNIIKPREKPRAKMLEADEALVASAATNGYVLPTPSLKPLEIKSEPSPIEEAQPERIKKRRKVRKHRRGGVVPSSLMPGNQSKGILGRIFGG